MRRWLSTGLQVLIFLAAVEAVCFAFGVISIHRGNAYLFYYPSLFAGMNNEQIDRERDAPPTGWPRDRSPRSQPHRQPVTCGAAMGGSFTFGADVGDADTWAYLASEKLGCNVDNLGVAGFAVDQSLLYYQEQKRQDAFVIFAVAPVMFAADKAASWTFYSKGPGNLPFVSLTKPRTVR